MRRVGLIYPGQRLKIPGRGVPAAALAESAPAAAPGGKTTYVVRSGDSLDQLARVFSTTAEKIREDNALADDALVAGRTLVVVNNRPRGPVRHTVAGGETIFGIARMYGMGLNEFLSLNRLQTDSVIYAGQELWVAPSK
jgi:LysM repeat protein